MNQFKYRCVMIDNSRNAVMNMTTAKKMIDCLAKMGFNSLMLYTEDTYEVDGHPYFGYLRGRYNKEELKELDAYAKERKIELIPCIQTLGHLATIMRWPQYAALQDGADTLCADEEKVYGLIEDMFSSIAECFTSRMINVGMDEAETMGLGKYLKKYGYQERLEIFGRHLERVSGIAEKYGFTLCMWSDMFYKLATGTFYGAEDADITDEQAERIKKMIPENVRLTYFDYWNWEKSHFDHHIKLHQKLAKDIWYAGAVWGYVGYAPHNAFSIDAGRNAITSCIENGVDNVMITMWGDDGAECARFSLLPSLYFDACLLQGITDEDEIGKGFEELFEIPFDAFMLLDYQGTTNDRWNSNLDKVILFNDPFYGIYDMAIAPDEGAKFHACAEKLSHYIEHSEWGYLFRTSKALADVLEIKAHLGQHTRKAYDEKDFDRLKCVIKEYEECIRRMNLFYDAYEVQWMIENKPNGFEVQDIRLGGVVRRLEHCKRRLEDYVNGKLAILPELEEELLDPYENGKQYIPQEIVCIEKWNKIVSVNTIS